MGQASLLKVKNYVEMFEPFERGAMASHIKFNMAADSGISSQLARSNFVLFSI